ncbi:hypothetical protein PISL3812_00120 [Talaromyces islandicus]|uniref:DUF6594 domain-containing protein n=1 Tax=Talaromyces islandicus TaxID=28573 RepID=A0A0U1LID6_TALIS|nr:hypothetical protein PISL3812_00120 [Talaromyces islandicus]
MSQQENSTGNFTDLFLSKPRIAAAKRFDAISLKIILGLQSELREIECRGFQDIPPYSLDRTTISQSSTHSTIQAGSTGEQLATFDDVRKKMETYHDFVLRFIKLYSLKPLDNTDHIALLHHLSVFRQDHPEANIDSKIWMDNNDLIGVRTTHLPKRDRFTRFLTDVLSWLTKRKLLRKLWKGDDRNVYMDEEKIGKFVVVLNVFIASLLNMLALFVLYAIHSTLARIGTICAFSLLFMLCALFFTAAEPVTVYNSTAAYSAVLVVFISNVN